MKARYWLPLPCAAIVQRSAHVYRDDRDDRSTVPSVIRVRGPRGLLNRAKFKEQAVTFLISKSPSCYLPVLQ